MTPEDAARRRLEALEQRVREHRPHIPDEYYQLRDQIRDLLHGAHADGLIKQSIREIKELLSNSSKEPDKEGRALVRGGPMNIEDWATAGQFERDDGARFNFNLTVFYPKGAAPSLKIYHFNLSSPPGSPPGFLRFDWDETIADAKRHPLTSPMLCHTHLAHPRLTVPSPVLSPLEVLDLILRHPEAGRSAK